MIYKVFNMYRPSIDISHADFNECYDEEFFIEEFYNKECFIGIMDVATARMFGNYLVKGCGFSVEYRKDRSKVFHGPELIYSLMPFDPKDLSVADFAKLAKHENNGW